MVKHSVVLDALCCENRPHVAKGLCSSCYQKHSKHVQTGFRCDGIDRLVEIVQGHSTRKDLAVATRRTERDRRRIARGQASGYFRNSSLQKRYGITTADFDRMLAEQDGCAICHKEQAETQFYVDHCHGTGRIRGILCPRCNTLVGFIETSADLIPVANNYLRKVDQ